MAEPLKYKAELGIKAYIQAEALGALSGYSYFAGQYPQQSTLPCVIVEATGQAQAFPDALPKNVTLVVHVLNAIDTDTDADSIHGEAADRTANHTTHRAAVQAIEAALQDLTGIKAYLNAVNVTNRPVSAFYVYDIIEDGQGTEYSGEDRIMHSTISITLTCEAQDN